MIVNWFSPLPPARSGIASYATDVLAELGKLASVRVFSAATVDENSIPGVESFVYYDHTDDLPWDLLNTAEITIYHLGNNVEFHQEIWEVSCAHPGVVVLHDSCMQHFFHGLYARRRDLGAWIDLVEHWHGGAARTSVESYLAGGTALETVGQRYPLTKAAILNALGVVVHNPAIDWRPGLPQPFLCLPLPYSAPSGNHASRRSAIAGRPCRLIVFGYLGPNRGLDLVVEALAGMPEPSAFHLDVYGVIADVESIRSQIAKHGLSNLVTLHGFVGIEELGSALDNADLAINLRLPSMGEASLSQLQIWAHALPSLVSKTGWYATLPGNTVVFVDPGNEVPSIRAILTRYLENPADFAAIGRHGLDRLRSYHQPKNYAGELLHFCASAARFRSSHAGYGLAERVGVQLGATFGRELEPGLTENALAQIDYLCRPASPD